MGSTHRLAMIFGLIGCFWHGVCQRNALDSPQQSSPDPISFERFFQQVAQLRNVSRVIFLNGQPSKLTQLTAQDTIGLTDEESRVLHAVASDCEAKIHSFDASVRSSIFQARLQLIESENTPLAIQQLQDLKGERDQIVLTHIQKLRAGLGDSRFRVLDIYVRSLKPGEAYFPLVPARN